MASIVVDCGWDAQGNVTQTKLVDMATAIGPVMTPAIAAATTPAIFATSAAFPGALPFDRETNLRRLFRALVQDLMLAGIPVRPELIEEAKGLA